MITLKNIQTEVDTGFLYKILADNGKELNVAKVFTELSAIEHDHALAFLAKNNLIFRSQAGLFWPSSSYNLWNGTLIGISIE